MKYFPIFIDLRNKKAVVIGGGEVALRKVKDLLDAGALVTVIAPRLHDELASLCGKNPLHVSREYREGDLSGAALAFSATDDSETNRRVFHEAQEKGIWLNSVDDPDHCTFIVPSSFSRDDLIVAVSTSGASPSYAAKLRRIIETAIPSNAEETIAALKEARNILKNDIRFASLSSAQRGNLLKKISSDDRLIENIIKHKKDDTIADFLKGLL